MRRIFILLLTVLLSAGSAYSANLSLGGSGINSTCYSVLSVTGDYESDVFSYSETLNANLSNKDYGMESFVMNSIEYDDGTVGVRYAPLEGLTLGYGMLVSGLDTTYYQPAFQQNEQRALKVGYASDDYSLEGFGTYSHLYGGQIKDISFYNLKFGLEFASNAKDDSTDAFGRSETGAFVEMPVMDFLSLFAETSTSSNRSDGTMAGAEFDYDLIVAYSRVKVAAVSFSPGFVPGYFTSGYDIDPVNFSSLEAQGNRRYGTMTTIDTGLLGVINLDFTNENYTDGGSANSGSIYVSPADFVTLSAFVKELSFLDFRDIKGQDADMIGASLRLAVTHEIVLSANYIKAPDVVSLKPYETSFIQASCSF